MKKVHPSAALFKFAPDLKAAAEERMEKWAEVSSPLTGSVPEKWNKWKPVGKKTGHDLNTKEKGLFLCRALKVSTLYLRYLHDINIWGLKCKRSLAYSYINNRHYFVTCIRWNKTGKGILCIEQGKPGCQFLFYLQLLKVLTQWVFFSFFGNTLPQPKGSIILTATMITPYHSFPYSMLSKSIDSSLQVKMP